VTAAGAGPVAVAGRPAGSGPCRLRPFVTILAACSRIIGKKKFNGLWKETLTVEDILAGLNLLDDDKVTGYIQKLNQAAADAAVAPLLARLEATEAELAAVRAELARRKERLSRLRAAAEAAGPPPGGGGS
jgi:hypothetical protein